MIPEVQLDSYAYPYPTSDVAAASVYGANVPAAWSRATGVGVAVALIDSGFDPSVLTNFSAASRSFATDGSVGFAPPNGTYHGIATSGVVGAPGLDNGPIGIAPNAIVEGLKVTFGNFDVAPFSAYVDALSYGAATASVISNSWAIGGYGLGAPFWSYYAPWYTALQGAVNTGRGGLGTVVVFAAGNDRANAADIGVQPVTSDPRVIAVAATTAAGVVADFSSPGAGLLTAEVGVDVLAPEPGLDSAYGYYIMYGTSFSAPQISAIVALMLEVNPNLGWRDVQAILAASSYAPPPSAAGFITNGATGWNGGGMHFSRDLGFGVADANVAVNLARAWTLRSTDANLDQPTATQSAGFAITAHGSASSTLQVGAGTRLQHVQLRLEDTGLLAAYSTLVLTSPSGTRSVLNDHTGLVSGVDQSNALDLSGYSIDSNAFWGESAAGAWTLVASNDSGQTATIADWSLTLWGDAPGAAPAPMIFTPEFASLVATDPARARLDPAGATAIDLIALPGTTTLNLNGGAGQIDGVAVTLASGLRDLNASGSTGDLTVTAALAGSHITGGDGLTTIYGGGGGDTVQAGLGASAVFMGSDTHMTFRGGAAAATIHAGAGTLSVVGGSGAETIVVDAANAGGMTQVQNFTPGLDSIVFAGFSLLDLTLGLLGEVADGLGGTLLTLAGNIRIDVSGTGAFNLSLSGTTLVAAAAPGIAALDVSSNTVPSMAVQGYTGPVANLATQYICNTADDLAVTASTDGWFIRTGSGADAVTLHGGTNVVDGGTGSNFLTAGSGADTFFVDARNASTDIWSTLTNFHSGDAATLWGVNQHDFDLIWGDGQGAAGYSGLTLHASEAGHATASLTLAGYTQADLQNGRLDISFGLDSASGSSYMYVHAT